MTPSALAGRSDTEPASEPVAPAESDAPRRMVVAAAALAVVPVVVAAVRALADGWFPVGDNALFVIRARDVFGGELPLLGTWSSASLTLGFDLNHPGPLLFDLLAVPVRLLPHGRGVAIGIVLLDIAMVTGTIAAAWRRGGPVLGSAAAVVAAALCWSMGSEVLLEPWNPHSMVLPFLFLLVLVWSLVDGDVVLLPVAVAVASLLVQTHLSYGLLVPALLALGLAGLVLAMRRRRREDPLAWPALRRRAVRSALLAGVVAVLCSAQPVAEQLFGTGRGNLSRLAESGTGTSGVVGWGTAVRLVGDVLGNPPWWLRPSFATTWRAEPERNGLPAEGVDLLGFRPALAGLVLVVLALCACAVLATRRRDRTALAALVVAGAAVVLALGSAARVPLSELGDDYTLAPHQYRWLWSIAAFATLAGAAAVLRALTRDEGRAGLQDRGIEFVAESEDLVRQLGEDRRFDGSNARSRLLLVVGTAADEPFGGEPEARRLVLREALDPDEEQEMVRLRQELEADLRERGALPLNERGREAAADGRLPEAGTRLPFDPVAVLDSRALMIAGLRGYLEGAEGWRDRVERYAELQLRLDEETVALFVAPLR
ncbi:MAG: hypothetical protein K0R11_1001 [Acidimicrobiales bacterium]|nr:hypothetical protein [Acidimicrobiales bacterium]